MRVAPFYGMAKSKRKGSGPPQAPADTPAVNADRDRVAQRAYELYVLRGRGDGRDKDDWFVAERELMGGLSSDTHKT